MPGKLEFLTAGVLAAFFALSVSAKAATDEVVQHVIDYATAHPDGRAPASFNRTTYDGGDLRDLPIGVFDSGIGGLTVLEALLTIDVFHNNTLQPGADGHPDFENEHFVYFGDQANMPYGNYPASGKTDYLRELILKDALFLLGGRWFPSAEKPPRSDKPPVKAIVIACNTATAYGLQDIRDALAAWKLPVIVIGVVEAGARGVLDAKRDGSIGVLATIGTCASEAYPRTITRALGLAGRSVPVITQLGSAGLAGVIEGDPAFTNSVSDQAMLDVQALVENHRRLGARAPLDTVVLGCTHYPLAQHDIDAAFDRLRKRDEYRPLIAEHISYVNPAEWTARELFRELAAAKLRLKLGEHCRIDGNRFFISIANPKARGVRLSTDGALEKDYKYGRHPGRLDFEDTINVPMRLETLPATGRSLIESKLPAVAASLRSIQ